MSFACKLSFITYSLCFAASILCPILLLLVLIFFYFTRLIRLWSVVRSKETKVLLGVKVEETTLRSALVTHADKCRDCNPDQGSDGQELVFRRSVLDIEEDL